MLQPHPESLVLESSLDPSPQYPKIPQPESHYEYNDLTKFVLTHKTKKAKGRDNIKTDSIINRKRSNSPVTYTR